MHLCDGSRRLPWVRPLSIAPCPRLRPAEIGGAQKQHCARRVLDVEPDERQMRELVLEQRARTAYLADKRSACGQVLGRLAQDPAEDVEPVGSAGMGDHWLGGIFGG